jgi:hypothetical protein
MKDLDGLENHILACVKGEIEFEDMYLQDILQLIHMVGYGRNEGKMSLLTFDTHLHDISPVGSHRMIAVPNATDEEVKKIIDDGKVTVWNDWYITKSMRLLKEAGYQPIILDSIVGVEPHDSEPYIAKVVDGGHEAPDNPETAGISEEGEDEEEDV